MGDNYPLFSKEFLATYDVGRKLGEGAFGVVVKGIQRDLDRPVAIKLMLRRRTENIEVKKRFIREARLLAQLSHPNIVKIFAYGTDRDTPYIVEEYLEGSTFDAFHRANKPLELSKILDVFGQTAGALAAAHEVGILHRDLKPENMFILDDGQIKLLDFGLAKRPGKDTEMTKTGMIVGTPMFVAPEQVAGEKVTPATDLYALGTMMFMLISGEWPFETVMPKVLFSKLNNAAPSLASVAPHCSRKLVELVDEMLATHQRDRPQNALDVQKRIEAIADDLQQGSGISRALGDVRRAGAGRGAGDDSPARGVGDDSAECSKVTYAVRTHSTRRWPLAFALFSFALLIGVLVAPHYWDKEKTLIISNLSIKAEATEVSISWTTAREMKTECKVEDKNGLSRHIADKSAKRRNHKVTIRGLQSGKTYSFRPVFGDVLGMAHVFSVPLPRQMKNNHLLKQFRIFNVSATSLSISIRTYNPATVYVELKDVTLGTMRKLPFGNNGTEFSKKLSQLKELTKYELTPVVKVGDKEMRGSTETVTTGKVNIRMVLTGFGVKHKQGELDFTSMWTEQIRTVSAPRTWQDRLFIGMGRHGILCLDPYKCIVLWWNKDVKEPLAMKVYEDKLYVHNGQGSLTCLRCDNGQVVWKSGEKGNICTPFLVDDFGILLWYVGKGGKVFSTKTGRLRSRIKAECERAIFVKINKYILWIAEGGRTLSSANVALNVQEEVASLPDDDGAQRMINVGNKVIIGSQKGVIYLWSDKKLTRMNVDLGVPVSRLATDGNNVYAMARIKDRLCALDLDANSLLWMKRLPADPRGSLLCHHEKLYVSLGGTHVHSFAIDDGEELWKRYTNVKASFELVPLKDGVVCCSGFKDIAAIMDEKLYVSTNAEDENTTHHSKQ